MPAVTREAWVVAAAERGLSVSALVCLAMDALLGPGTLRPAAEVVAEDREGVRGAGDGEPSSPKRAQATPSPDVPSKRSCWRPNPIPGNTCPYCWTKHEWAA